MTIEQFNQKYSQGKDIKYGIEYRYCEKTGIKNSVIMLTKPLKEKIMIQTHGINFDLKDKDFYIVGNGHINQELLKDFMTVIETEVNNNEN